MCLQSNSSHSAQHARQLAYANALASHPTASSSEEVAGLPLPERLFE
jgi:hypothetical protein